MAEIVIRHESNSGSCEDCGYYERESVWLLVDGQQVAEFWFSGHFGDGNFNPHDETSLAVEILRALGHSVTVQEIGEDDAHTAAKQTG